MGGLTVVASRVAGHRLQGVQAAALLLTGSGVRAQ